jgi:hypothetical protein
MHLTDFARKVLDDTHCPLTMRNRERKTVAGETPASSLVGLRTLKYDQKAGLTSVFSGRDSLGPSVRSRALCARKERRIGDPCAPRTLP